MSMITELFGVGVLYLTKEAVIEKIKALPPSQQERHSYLLHDWSAATGKELTAEDFKAVEQ